MSRRLTAGVISLVLAVACTGSSGVSETTGQVVTVTSVASETTAPPIASSTSSATTVATAPVTTVATTVAAPTTTQSRGPSGSGCTPGDAITLPEGEWYGVVVSASASGIEFDLACWFMGEAAVEAAAADGAEAANDYYVRNDNPLIRSLPVSSETEVTWYPTGDPTSEVVVTYADWVAGVTARGPFFGVWLNVIDGEVFRIREQWVP
ncbi:MAG TPA: hypothetical protein VHM29_06950 [Acidimicrobiia bacterium]|nr:hypothetical protein [Acidimicrobiia bacterium]